MSSIITDKYLIQLIDNYINNKPKYCYVIRNYDSIDGVWLDELPAKQRFFEIWFVSKYNNARINNDIYNHIYNHIIDVMNVVCKYCGKKIDINEFSKNLMFGIQNLNFKIIELYDSYYDIVCCTSECIEINHERYLENLGLMLKINWIDTFNSVVANNKINNDNTQVLKLNDIYTNFDGTYTLYRVLIS